MPSHIAIMDDDPEITKMIQRFLKLKNFKTSSYHESKEYKTMLDQGPDLILLDINMPNYDGYEICKKIRSQSQIPIIFLTARDQEADHVKGLMIGGDDYITKPFSLEILYARIQVQLNKTRNQTKASSDGFQIHQGKRSFSYKNQEILLTKTEFDILALLSSHKHMVFDKERIYTALWGYDALGDHNVVAEHIRNLRKKTAKVTSQEIIETIWGVGYKWIG
jgi:DNA-binding response OmpR family regulator